MFSLFENQVNVPDEFKLTEEEIKRRMCEMNELTPEQRKILGDIQGKQNTRYISLEKMIRSTHEEIYNEYKEDDDFEIDSDEYSEEFIKFVNFILTILASKEYYGKYWKNVETFEDILNFDLDKEDPLDIFRKAGIKLDNESESPLSGLEIEVTRRFEKMTETNHDLVNIFLNIDKIEGFTWGQFEQMI